MNLTFAAVASILSSLDSSRRKLTDGDLISEARVVQDLMIKLTEKLLVEVKNIDRPADQKDTLTESEIELLRQSYSGGTAPWTNKIPAIKAVRERTGYGLKEAKDLVEDWMRANLETAYPNGPLTRKW